MAKEMGKYCKAYPIARFREYPGWSEQFEQARSENNGDGDQGGEGGASPSGRDFLYLQENYVVTDGVFKDENIIFDQVTPEWIEFCREVLKFEVPEYESSGVKEPVEEAGSS